MKATKRSRVTLGFAAILTTSALALSGCTSGEGGPEETDTSTPTAEAPDVGGNPSTSGGGGKTETPTEEGAPPEALAVEDKSLQETAEKYIHERENQASQFRKKPEDWLKSVKKYMTSDGFAQLKSTVGTEGDASGGYAWNVSHDKGLSVKAQVGECVELTQAGGGSDTEKTVSCSLTDLVVDKKGKNVPTADIPSTWPFVGDQQDALLSMKKDGKGWKVDMDMTGMAN